MCTKNKKYSTGKKDWITKEQERFDLSSKSIELGMIQELNQDECIVDALQNDEVTRTHFNTRSGSLPSILKTNGLKLENEGNKGKEINGKGTITSVNYNYFIPKISRRTNIKELLPSYQSSIKGILFKRDSNSNVNLKINYKRKVGLGADLSDVMNESYKPEKDQFKINNSIISDKKRTEAYIDTKWVDKLLKRNASISSTNNFLKSYDDPFCRPNKLKHQTEETSNIQMPKLEQIPQTSLRYQFGLDYYTATQSCTHQDEFLDKVSRKKRVGPDNNSVSSNFILSIPVQKPSRNKYTILKRNSMDDLIQNQAKDL